MISMLFKVTWWNMIDRSLLPGYVLRPFPELAMVLSLGQLHRWNPLGLLAGPLLLANEAGHYFRAREKPLGNVPGAIQFSS
jgi:hypothetical protein